MRLRWLLLLSLPAAATANCNRAALYLGEIKVLYSTLRREVPEGNYDPSRWRRQNCGEIEVEGNLIHRVIYDSNDRPYFGFDVRITPVAASKGFRIELTRPRGKFTVPEQIPGKKSGSVTIDGNRLVFFRRPPAPVILSDGARLSFPLLQDSTTGTPLVYDSIEIGSRGIGISEMPNLREPPKPPPPGTLLRLEQPELTHPFYSYGANTEAGVLGPVVWIYARPLGRVLFSATPRPGYLQKAFADGSSIRFSVGVETYNLKLHAYAIAMPGIWELWMKSEPDAPVPGGPWTLDQLRRGLLALGFER